MKLARAAILAIMLCLFATFAITFPDAPIHPCPSGFCGKQGQAHTEAEYLHFKFRETALFVVWPVGILAVYLLLRADQKSGVGKSG